LIRFAKIKIYGLTYLTLKTKRIFKLWSLKFVPNVNFLGDEKVSKKASCLYTHSR